MSTDLAYLDALPQQRMGAGCLFSDERGRVLDDDSFSARESVDRLSSPFHARGWLLGKPVQ